MPMPNSSDDECSGAVSDDARQAIGALTALKGPVQLPDAADGGGMSELLQCAESRQQKQLAAASVASSAASAAGQRMRVASTTVSSKKRKRSNEGVKNNEGDSPDMAAHSALIFDAKDGDDRRAYDLKKRPDSRSADYTSSNSGDAASEGSYSTKSSNLSGYSTKKHGSTADESKTSGSDSGEGNNSDKKGTSKDASSTHAGIPQRRQHHQHQHQLIANSMQQQSTASRSESTQQERRRYLNRLNARKSRERKKNRQEEMLGRLKFLEAESDYLKSLLKENKIAVKPFSYVHQSQPEDAALDIDV